MKYLGHLLHSVLTTFLSRKLLMACTAIWMTYGIYWGAVKQIYTFDKPEQLTAFTTFTNYEMWVTATIALWYIGIQTAANFSNSASVASLMQSAMSSTSEKIEEKITEIRIDPKDVDDGSVD